jgi:hypothetical protein
MKLSWNKTRTDPFTTLTLSASAEAALRAGNNGPMFEESVAAARAASGPQNAFIGTSPYGGKTFWNGELPELLNNMDNGTVPIITIHNVK